MYAHAEEDDWEITSEGLYVATRGFLCRRGYCCANRCRNCPYINWRYQRAWRPVDPAYVRQVNVSPKAIAGAQTLLEHHAQELEHCLPSDQQYHHSMIAHYQRLLQLWRS
ncbi:MAG TPA: DUF5522 domain-containing protein [Ktedonosporobacter sp.]|nr:DUF5522 domain-containing protein [Ktedonosporobacter sp.]